MPRKRKDESLAEKRARLTERIYALEKRAASAKARAATLYERIQKLIHPTWSKPYSETVQTAAQFEKLTSERRKALSAVTRSKREIERAEAQL